MQVNVFCFPIININFANIFITTPEQPTCVRGGLFNIIKGTWCLFPLNTPRNEGDFCL